MLQKSMKGDENNGKIDDVPGQEHYHHIDVSFPNSCIDSIKLK